MTLTRVVLFVLFTALQLASQDAKPEQTTPPAKITKPESAPQPKQFTELETAKLAKLRADVKTAEAQVQAAQLQLQLFQNNLQGFYSLLTTEGAKVCGDAFEYDSQLDPRTRQPNEAGICKAKPKPPAAEKKY